MCSSCGEDLLQATYVESSNLNRFNKSTGVFNRDLLDHMSKIVFMTIPDEFKLCVPPNFNFGLWALENVICTIFKFF